jgi:LPXTG-motif cell wall-anchored protein
MESVLLRRFGVGAVALSGIALSGAFAPSVASAISACPAGVTQVSSNACEIIFRGFWHYVPPAGITKLDALIVGAGGRGYSPYFAYGGGGGDVKLVHLNPSGTVNVTVGSGGTTTDGVHHSETDSSVTQGTTTVTATGGLSGMSTSGGDSGNGNSGEWNAFDPSPQAPVVQVGGGGGAGGPAPHGDTAQGGPGLAVNQIAGAGASLFANDTRCFGGGGGAAVSAYISTYSTPWTHVSSTSVCGGGSVTAGQNPASHSATTPRANSGSGGANYYTYSSDDSPSWTVNIVSQPGADGVVILRFNTTQSLPDTGTNTSGFLGLGASALLAGAAALILGRRRNNA